MWPLYRLSVISCLLVLLTVFGNVQGSRITRPDSSNSIADEADDQRTDVLNDELLPADRDDSQRNRSAAAAAEEEDEDWLVVGSGDGQVISLPDSSSGTDQMADERSNSTVVEVDWSTIWPYFNTGCLQWSALNHVYFQLANSFLFLSYLAPAGLYGLIYLRAMLAIGCGFFAIWGWIVICAFDTFVWNALFFLINLVHGTYLLYTLKPVRFDKQVEEHTQWKMVYKNVFQPLKVSKQQFKKVVNCMKQIKPLKRGEHFAVEKQTRVETLSLLLSGSMLVNEGGKTLHVLHPMQFLDSPEWFGVSSDDYFQVSIRACEESRVLLWHRDKLKLILLSDPFLQAVFDHILGRDVVRKLTQMKEKIAGHANNSPFRNNLLNNSGLLVDNEKSTGSLMSSPKSSGTPSTSSTLILNNDTVHEHGSITAPEQHSLLDESVAKKVTIKSGTSATAINRKVTADKQPGRYDYSRVQHLGSTDI